MAFVRSGAANTNMRINAKPPTGSINGQPTTVDLGARVLVVFEPTSRGARALREAAKLVAQLTVVTLAPQECKRCCGPGAEPYNRVLREDAIGELREARRLLGSGAEPVVFRALVGPRTPAGSKRQLAMPLAWWVREHGLTSSSSGGIA